MKIEDVQAGQTYIYTWQSSDGWHFCDHVAEAVRTTPTGRVTIKYRLRYDGDGWVQKTVSPSRLNPYIKQKQKGAVK